jgi:acetyl-CoA acetyltransferase
MTSLYVAGVGMTPFGRHLDVGVYDLIGSAVNEALADAGARIDQVQWAAYGTVTHGFLHGQICVPGPIAMRRLGLQAVPVFTVENACASGSSAFHLAAQALRAGACDIALAVGAEKMNVPDKARMFGVFEAGWDVQTVEQNKQTLLELGRGVEPPPGTMSTRPYSVFMDVYAAFCRDHMRRYGTTQRQIAAVSAKNHVHSVHNPRAQYRQPYTVEEVLAAPPIAYPLTLPMCSPISDGAAAAVLCNDAGLRRLGGSPSRAIRIRASVVQIGVDRTADEPSRGISALAAERAYEQAGLGPEDVDVAEVHDATAMGELINVESLGLVPRGESGPAAERGELSVGGRIPVNTSGGLESKGHPVGATGLGQIHELVTQLRGEAGARQVQAARIAIQENGGGLFGLEEAVVAVQIFEGSRA